MKSKPNHLNRAAVLVTFLLFLFAPGMLAAQNVDAINDLLRGGGGAQQDPVPPFAPPAQPIGPAAPLYEGKTWSPPEIGKDADGHTTITYHGQAAADGRKARITLTFKGRDVTGKIWMQTVCESNVRLGGADLSFEARLSGAWESKDSRIAGDWAGTEHFCGSDVANHGSMEFFLKDDGYFDPVLHLRIIGERGRYGWNFAPAGREVVEDPSTGAFVLPTDDEDPVVPGGKDDGDPAGAGDKADEDPDGAGGKAPKSRLPWRQPIDPDTVTGFELLPGTLYLAPGKEARKPDVVALIRDEDGPREQDVREGLEWHVSADLEEKDRSLRLSPFAKDEKEVPFAVTVKLGPLEETLKGVVKVKKIEPLGSIAGKVNFQFSPMVQGGHRIRPLGATVELVPSGRNRAERQRFEVGQDGAFLFENLPIGLYHIEVRSVVPPDFPTGYVLDRSRPWGDPSPIWIGEQPAFRDEEPEIVYHHKRKSARVHVSKPKPMDGHLYGRVIFEGQGVEGVTVMARNTADSDIHDEAVSGKDGVYQIEIDDLPDGEYWIRAEKYRQTKRPLIAGPDDLLDIRTNRLGDAILVQSPLSDPRGLQIDIEVDTRHAIFGGPREVPHIPILPGD